MSPVSTTLIATLLTMLRSVDVEEFARVCMDYSRDCERRAALCDTNVVVMHRSCPKTCQLCEDERDGATAVAAAHPAKSIAKSHSPPSVLFPLKPLPREIRETSSATKSRRPSKKCRDIADDCEETLDLCDDPSFKKTMKKQCAKSCGYCRPSSSASRKSGSKKGGDRISGLAGEFGTLQNRKLSKGSKAKEIDGISISQLVKMIRKAEEKIENPACADMAYDCPIKAGLCGNARYSKLMLKMCRRTCNLCTTSSSTATTT
ncbi:hypothetical protein PRIPAC_97480 [Pristionchus pacificus]|uniref:ShK domain-containing protein n=1 Tax=Pristionchus pacificus TaxID=54126 RepID=A0A454XY99_PRIPA|nr:hypothetical protein PRIPAC_97480 [Pristionchus pacificus]|eukprot:PDM84298.1 ShK domain-containing protein [Pristionchus pacificus]